MQNLIIKNQHLVEKRSQIIKINIKPFLNTSCYFSEILRKTLIKKF